jgi:hypothetical protein
MNIKWRKSKRSHLEIYDLNLQEIIYSQRAIGTNSARTEKSGEPASDKLIDNISFHKSAKLMSGSLKDN